ncbi:7995_t:CDS:1, partial [Acaulospora morrowiae]
CSCKLVFGNKKRVAFRFLCDPGGAGRDFDVARSIIKGEGIGSSVNVGVRVR